MKLRHQQASTVKKLFDEPIMKVFFNFVINKARLLSNIKSSLRENGHKT